MKTIVHWIDVGPHLASGIQPVFLLERPLLRGTRSKAGTYNVAEVARTGRHWVAVTDLLGEKPEWAVVTSGQYVRIPVYAYKTGTRAMAMLLSTGLMLGTRAAQSLARKTDEPLESLILVLGHECTDMGDSFRCYAGVAFEGRSKHIRQGDPSA